MEKILIGIFASIIGGVDEWLNSVFNDLVTICFDAENYLTQILGKEVFNFSDLKTIILSFALSLIIVKFLKKGFDTYVLWLERG